jgi:nitrogen regulatory protein P-II 1
MTDNLAMTLITPRMEERVILALHDFTDFRGFTFTEVRGQGRGRGQGDAYVYTESHLIFYRLLELRLMCRSELADDICDRMASPAWTDGVVFTTTVNHFACIVGKRQERRYD